MIDLTTTLLERLIAMLPAAVRVAGMMVVAPGLSFQQAPPITRVLLAVALAVVIAPVAAGDAPVVSEPLRLMALCLVELVVGLALGFVAAAVLEALRFGGEVLDLQIGLRAGQLYDPSSGTQSGILSTAYALIATVFFVSMDGHHWLLRGLASSFSVVPTGAAGFGAGLEEAVAGVGTSIIVMGLRIAAPVMATLLLTDLAFGLVARAVPQINVFLVGIPAKTVIGLAVAALSMPLVLSNLDGVARLMAQALHFIMGALVR